tara:strand:+ start:1304 stop:1756 length:453 start_codon:yes stop_codon:yes gene_type:complete
VTGGYLEGNYNMGGSTRTGTKLPSMQDLKDATNIDEQIDAARETGARALEELPAGISHNLAQPGNYLFERFHGSMNKGGDDDDNSVTQRDTSAFAQSKRPRKKRKGLLALQTPSAKASRFRAGKRKFRVRPTGKTGVNVAGSNKSSVGTN